MPRSHEHSTCLPCRRSWVRIPSAASEKACNLRGFLPSGVGRCVCLGCQGIAKRLLCVSSFVLRRRCLQGESARVSASASAKTQKVVGSSRRGGQSEAHARRRDPCLMWRPSSHPAALLTAPRGVSGANGDARSLSRGRSSAPALAPTPAPGAASHGYEQSVRQCSPSTDAAARRRPTRTPGTVAARPERPPGRNGWGRPHP
jgi:hypothetical protein